MGLSATNAQQFATLAGFGLYQDAQLCFTPDCNSVEGSNCGRANFSLSADPSPAPVPSSSKTPSPSPLATFLPVPTHFTAFGPSAGDDYVTPSSGFDSHSLPLTVPIGGVNLTTGTVSTSE
jgi:hypothetical protein